MLDNRLLSRVIETALKKGGDFADVYVEKKSLSGILCEDEKIEKVNSGREFGAGIRVVADGNTAYAYTNNLSEQGLLETARTVAHAASGADRDITIKLKSRSSKLELPFMKMPEQVPFDDKVQTLLAADRAARSVGPEIRQVTVSMADLHKTVQIANSLGELVEDEVVRNRFVVNAVSSRGEIIQTGFEAIGGVVGWELVEETDIEELARQAAQRAVMMLDARPAPAGRMPVVMAKEAGGTMIHEACGHGLEADIVQKGLSVYSHPGDQVAAPVVSVIDDSSIAGKNGYLRFDDEGTPGRKNVLIEKGVLQGYMHDRITAGKAGVEPTGNGRRESYQHKPIPRMTNTYIASGDEDPDRIIGDTHRGLLVRKMGGGQVNTTTGDFVFDVQEGYIIENGEVKYPVRGATLTGNGPEVLRNIDLVGTDLGFGIGTCGKDGQGVPVADAQPTIRIKSMTVGGTMSSNGPGIKKIRRM